MMGFDGYGVNPWMWVVGSLMMVLFWGGLILLFVWAVRVNRGAHAEGSSENAIEVLKRRFAAGEITQDEFDKTRRVLHG